jgi:hypothetical protein
MAVVSREEKWQRWSGPLSTLIRAGEYAAVKVQENYDFVDELKPEVEFTLGDRVVTDAGLHDLEAIPLRDFDVLNNITIRVNRAPSGIPIPGVSLYVRKTSPAVTLEVQGIYEKEFGKANADIEGLVSRLRSILDDGRPKIRFAVGMPLGLLFFVAGFFLLLAATNSGGSAFRHAILIVSAVVGPVVAGLLVWWGLPILELLPPGRSSRSERFRGWLWAFTIALVAGMIAIPLYAALSHH